MYHIVSQNVSYCVIKWTVNGLLVVLLHHRKYKGRGGNGDNREDTVRQIEITENATFIVV